MKLTFFGTGPAEAIPRDGHADALCASARKHGSKSRRGRSSALLQIQGKNILIDVSPDFLSQARREQLKKIDAIFITHAHNDSYGGLPDLGKWIKISRHKPIPLYGHRSTIRAIKKYFPPEIKPISMPEYHTLNIAGIKVRFLPVNHGVYHIATFGFLFAKKLFYASDLDGAAWRAKSFIRGTRILVLDGAFWSQKRLRGHFTMPETIAFASKLRPKQLFITQSGHTYPPHNGAQKIIDTFCQKQKAAFNARLAYDGLKINI